MGGGGGSVGGGGGSIGGGGGSMDAGNDAGIDAGIDAGTDGGFFDDGGVLTWTDVAAQLFPPPSANDGGFTFEFSAAVPTGGWLGGVLTQQGDVICIPNQGGVALRIQRGSRNVSTLPMTDNESWEGGVLLGDGTVLGLPHEAKSFLSIPNDGGVPYLIDAGLAQPGAMTSPYFEAGVVTLSQKVILAPATGLYPGIFDPSLNKLTMVDAGLLTFLGTLGYHYSSAVLRADGETAILVPRDAINMIRVSTVTGVKLIGNVSAPGHAGGLLMQDGKILLVPTKGAARWAIYDDNNELLGEGDAGTGYFSAAWSTNGYGYAVQTDGPAGVLNVAVIDRNGAVTEVAITDGGIRQNSHYGLTAMEDGTIVGCPNTADEVLFITPTYGRQTVNRRAMTSPWLNKW